MKFDPSGLGICDFFFLLCDVPAVAQSSAYSDKLGPSSAAEGRTGPLL